MNLEYSIVDAFTNQPFGGNPAGVVILDGEFPSEDLMLHIAAELRYSETAFVLPLGEGRFRTRYFTPAAEVPLCGHATIAAFGVLHEKGLVGEGQRCLNVTAAGELDIVAGRKVMMRMAEPEIASTLDAATDARLRRIAGCEGDTAVLATNIASTGLKDIMMQVSSVGVLQALRPDMEALTALTRELGVVSLHAFALAADGHTAHVRDFAPLYGVPEESATGTANAALTYHLHRCGVLPPDCRCSFLQGEAMGRPSVVETTLTAGRTIYVGGQSYLLAHGTMTI